MKNLIVPEELRSLIPGIAEEEDNSGLENRAQNALEVASKGFVKQSNKITEAKFAPMSLMAKRLLAYLISSIPQPKSKNDIVLTKTLKISADKFIDEYLLKNKDDKNMRRQLNHELKRLANELITTKVTLTEDMENGRYVVAPILSYFEFYDSQENNGKVLVFSFTDAIKGELYNLRANFTTYNLAEYVSLSSSYSMALYSALARYKDTLTRVDKIENLRKIFNCEKLYKNNNHFIARTIKPAQEELENTSLAFTYQIVWEEPKNTKGRRKMKYISFTLLKTPQSAVPKSIETAPWWRGASNEIKSLVEVMLRFGIGEKALIEYTDLFEVEELKELSKIFHELQYPEKSSKITDMDAYRNAIFLGKGREKALAKELKENLMMLEKADIIEENQIQEIKFDTAGITKQFKDVLDFLNVPDSDKPKLILQLSSYIGEKNKKEIDYMLAAKSIQDLERFL